MNTNDLKYVLTSNVSLLLVVVVLSFTLLGTNYGIATENTINDYDLIVVRGDQIVDYTVVAPYSSEHSVPIISLSPDNISETDRRSLENYVNEGYEDLIVVGGEEAIPEDIEQELMYIGYNVERLWDWDRYGTASRVSIDLWRSSDEVVVVDGSDTDNLLIAQSYALELGVPVLYTEGDRVPDSLITSISRLNADKVYSLVEPEILSELNIDIEHIDTEEDIVTPEEEPDREYHYYLYYLIFLGIISFAIVYYYKHRNNIPYDVFTDDEKKLIDIIVDDKEVEQQELPERTEFSRSKVSRLVKDLRERDILEREKKKKTYVLRLKRNIEY